MSNKPFQLSEEQEQSVVIQWRDIMVNQYPELQWMIHIPNGGLRSKSEAVRLKRVGVRAGVSDLFLPVSRKGYHGLWIEMKKQRGGRLSEYQKDWLEGMNKEGYMAVRANGADEAIKILEEYLG